MNKYKKDLKEKGWTIINCDKLLDVSLISKSFIRKVAKIENISSKIKEKKINNINEFRKFALELDDSSLNQIRKLYLKNFSIKIIKAFSKSISSVFGKNLLIQKYPQIQVHVGFKNSTKTFPHSEIMSAHSPFTFNIWLPFHQIEDNSGIFLIKDNLSVKLCDNEIKNNIKDREKLLSKHFFFPKLKFGQALILNAFVYHGSIYHRNKKARISVDARFQISGKPMFEKYNDFFESFKWH